MKLLSVVVPCYNEQDVLPLFYNKIVEIADKMKISVNFEIVFIDDGSLDKTLLIIKSLSEKDERIKYISFSRNFGKEAAIYAGLKKAKGEFVAIIDADLQDPPKLLLDMYNGIVNEDYDCIATQRVTRQGEPHIRSFFTRCFYSLINKISKTEIVNGARDYRLMTRQVVNSILSLREYNRFSKGIFSWIGFKTKWIPYENVERAAGKTKWSFWTLLLYSFDGIVAFSTAPLAIASIIGMILFFISIVLICIIIAKTLIFGDPVSGYPSTVCIIMFIGGIQLFCIGILGQYLSKTYLESKSRPVYIIKEEK
ncbi:MAG: putative glycosyltransferase CsbB [Eubacteriales bacterium SKADARSKE-1]|nr:putative glycosyltransferase CsbB [Eubacteriales bacterium SKADARSKE-1]